MFMIRNKHGLLTINQFARICRSTARTIRFYEEKGLLKPFKVDNSTGYRYYIPEQTRDFFRIKLLQNFDIPLSSMKKSLKKSSDEGFLNDELQKLKREIEKQKKKYDFLARINTFLHDPKSPEKYISTQVIKQLNILAIQKKAVPYSALSETINDLYKYARENGFKVKDQIVVTYLDPDKYQPQKANLEIGIVCESIENNKILTDGLFLKKIPEQEALVYIYEGPYEYLTFIHQKLFYSEFFKKFEFTNFPFDWEIKGIANTESSYNYVTQIVYPIK